MKPNGNAHWIGRFFPFDFFDHARVGFFDQSAQLRQFYASPITRRLDDIINLLLMGISLLGKNSYLISSLTYRLPLSLKHPLGILIRCLG